MSQRGVDLNEFGSSVRCMESIASATHRIDWFGTGHDLLEAKLKAIDTAERTVRMETYIFTDEAIGRRFRAALIAAARRGVEVHLIVDAVGGGDLPKNYFAELDALPNAGMKWFNELSLSSWAFRDHRKLLVIDSHSAFVGGCNIAEDYHGDGVTHGWRDGGVRIEGPLALELETEFDSQFASATDRQWRVLKAKKTKAKERQASTPAIRPLFVHPGFGQSPLRDAVREDLKHAKDIAITSAYFLPTRGLLNQFAHAVENGARMRLMLGGKSDVKLMQMATRGMYPRLMSAGIEVFEYGPQILHAKLLIIDDAVYVGSSNLDPRSLRINFEVMVRVDDPELAARARQQFETDVKLSRMISPKDCWETHWWERVMQMVAQWVLARVDPRMSENMLRRLESRP
jgi:cardiolipin synthase